MMQILLKELRINWVEESAWRHADYFDWTSCCWENQESTLSWPRQKRLHLFKNIYETKRKHECFHKIFILMSTLANCKIVTSAS